ncbi:hypothetical protein F5Y16DRAFT_378959 [Xylariaceae sp. FL0255]|nr:hypothetical protein F5Y16DRAFT_378959 [Xylariaceae sp. FL0255]
MTTITNLLTLLAAIPTPATFVIPTSTAAPSRIGECGKVDVFYTGFTPYHPMVAAQGWDLDRVAIGIRNDTLSLVEAGYNVHAVWAGTEIPISTLEERLDQTNVEFDLLGIGWGVRGAQIPIIVERFEDLIDMYHRKRPDVPIVFNYSPESFLWSVAHRIPMGEDCKALQKPGTLYGYEEICDSRCDLLEKQTRASRARHDEL